MVNINLNQEDEYRQQSFKDDSFAQTLNLESRDFSDDRQEFETELPEFPKSRSNTRIYILAAGLLAVVLFIAYMLIPKGDDLSKFEEEFSNLNTPPQAEMTPATPQEDLIAPVESGMQPESTAMAPPTATTTTAAPVREDVNAMSLGNLPPLEQEMKISTHMSALAMEGVVNALDNASVFTLVRFADNALLAELAATGTNSLNTVVDGISRNTGSQDMRLVSQDNTMIQGRGVLRALISGTMNVNSAPAVIRGSVNAVSNEQLLGWLRSTAQSSQMSVKVLKTSPGDSGTGYPMTHVQLNMEGSLAGALGFMRAMQAASYNVVVDKMLLINNDASASSTTSVSLVLVLKHYGA